MNDITNVTQLRSRLSDDLCQTYPVMTDKQGEPWFVLKDICDALGLGNTLQSGRPPRFR